MTIVTLIICSSMDPGIIPRKFPDEYEEKQTEINLQLLNQEDIHHLKTQEQKQLWLRINKSPSNIAELVIFGDLHGHLTVVHVITVLKNSIITALGLEIVLERGTIECFVYLSSVSLSILSLLS